MKHYFYHVADCEHDGDDCGEAYIEFTIPNGNEEKVLKALHLYHK